MTDTKATDAPTVLRPGSGKVWCLGAWVIGAGLVITQFVIGAPLTGLKGTAAVLLVGYLLWLVLWSPSVTLSPSTITVRNFLRSWEIDWSAVLDLPLGMSMAVATREKTITVAAAPGRGSYQVGRAGALGRFARVRRMSPTGFATTGVASSVHRSRRWCWMAAPASEGTGLRRRRSSSSFSSWRWSRCGSSFDRSVAIALVGHDLRFVVGSRHGDAEANRR
jgi:hypothetical protein